MENKPAPAGQFADLLGPHADPEVERLAVAIERAYAGDEPPKSVTRAARRHLPPAMWSPSGWNSSGLRLPGLAPRARARPGEELGSGTSVAALAPLVLAAGLLFHARPGARTASAVSLSGAIPGSPAVRLTVARPAGLASPSRHLRAADTRACLNRARSARRRRRWSPTATAPASNTARRACSGAHCRWGCSATRRPRARCSSAA